jgi:hypothetical protein
MPTIEGVVEESGRVIVVDETTGAIDSNTTVSSGTYSVSSSSMDPKIVLFRRESDGNTLGYSSITSIDDTPFLGAESTFADGVTYKDYLQRTSTMIDSPRFVVLFRNQAPQYTYYSIGTISGESASFTTPTSLGINLSAFDSGYDFTYEKLFIFTTSQYRICTISGNTLNLGDYTAWPTDIAGSTILKVLYNDTTHTLLVFYKVGSSMRAMAATFDGNSFSFGSYDIVYPSAGTIFYTNAYYDSSSGGYFVVFHSSEGTAYVTMVEVSGNTVTSPYSNYSSGKTGKGNSGCCCSPSRNLFFISVWYDGQWVDTHTIISFSYSGGVFTKLHQYDIGGSHSDANPILLYDEPSDKLMFIADSGASTRRYRLLDYDVSTGFSVSSTVTFSSNTIYYPNVILDSSTGKRVVTYGLSGSFAGLAKVFRL